jgi:hypothetical protein
MFFYNILNISNLQSKSSVLARRINLNFSYLFSIRRSSVDGMLFSLLHKALSVTSNFMKTLLSLIILTFTTVGCANKQTPKDEKLSVAENRKHRDHF